jgi:quercetin dioxygenase-like cupin family protein
MFSASSEARDRNAPTNANQIRQQTSRIGQEHRPIRYQLPARLSFRQGQWHLSLAPGERIGFHTHVLDYFWTAMTSGKARSHYGDGEIREVSYAAGDTKHHIYAPSEFMTHDLENIGDTPLIFATVEFLHSANAPLEVKAPESALVA